MHFDFDLLGRCGQRCHLSSMIQQTMSKRKAPAARGSDVSAAHMAVDNRPPPLPSLDLSNSKTTSEIVAAALLLLLTNGGTRQDAAAKKLGRAISLLMAELDAGSIAMARANESEGTRLPIAFPFLVPIGGYRGQQ